MRQLTALSATLFLAMVATQAQAETVRVGIPAEPYPPFSSMKPNGTWKGFEVDLVHAICATEKLDCPIVATPWDGIIPALTSKKIDLIVGSMSITAKRKKVIDFTNPYYTAAGAFIGRAGMKIDGTPASVRGKIIGVQVSTTYSDFAEKTYGSMAQIKMYQTQDQADADLVAGRVDLLIAGKIPMEEWLKKPEAKGFAVVGDVPFSEADIQRVGAGVRKDDPALKATFDKGLAAILKNGTYDRIAKKYFDFDIYGLPRN